MSFAIGKALLVSTCISDRRMVRIVAQEPARKLRNILFSIRFSHEPKKKEK